MLASVVAIDVSSSAFVWADSKRRALSCDDKPAIKRSVNTGLARHSVMINGSFPSASKSSRNYVGLFRVLSHAIHLSLQLLSGNRPLPVILQRLRVAQIISQFRFQLRLTYHRIEWWLGIRTFLWPEPVPPVHFLDSSLVGPVLGKR